MTVHITAQIELKYAIMFQATSLSVYGYLARLGAPPRNSDLQKTEKLAPGTPLMVFNYPVSHDAFQRNRDLAKTEELRLL